MTLTLKAEKSGLELDKVVELAESAGIKVGADEELTKPDAIKLGVAVKAFQNQGDGDPSTVRFWTAGKNKTIVLGKKGTIRVRDHALVLDKGSDAAVIKMIYALKNVIGLFEVKDAPFDEDSDAYEKFDDRLRELAFTGAGNEASRGGIKAIRALFSEDQLLGLGDKAFNPKRLVAKALSSRSIVHIHNV